MGADLDRSRLAGLKRRLSTASALGFIFAVLAGPLPEAYAQDLGALAGSSVPSDSQMLLEADTLTYDNDSQIVTAAGRVRIDYGGNRLVAQRVSYDQKSKRLLAEGDVEIVDPQGTRVTSDKIDITDDFGEGFLNALRIETADKTYFAAESATRRSGRVTTFNNGVYTACAPCEEKPDKAPIWRIKARKIIWDGQEKVVRFEQSRFELFGFPIAYFPAFETADPTVKRKSGFLIPSVTQSDELGVGVTVPYYFALSPTFDLTVTGSYFTKQGFLGQAEWRQRFNNGEYSIQVAGINQREPSAFDPNTVDSGPDGDPNEGRAMLGTRGQFDINPRWTFGWDYLAQTDKNFSKTYGIANYAQTVQRNQAYLVGLNDRNYFDLRAMEFRVQEEVLDSDSDARDEEQPLALPTFDYSVTPDEPVLGGELNLDFNARAIKRDALDAFTSSSDIRSGNDPFIRGLEGDNGRVTGEAEWRKTLITDAGLVITPILAFQADAGYDNASDESIARVNEMAERLNASSAYQGDTVSSDVVSEFNRYMATAGLEMRWPVLFSSSSATHILEPTAQLFARPDEQYAGDLSIPNEDAQSFVFDATTLFERDKFSGYDRIEGGTRANVGFRYTGTFGGGWSTNAIFGQSYQLAGENSFNQADFVNVGAYSGLESDTSDFVALAGLMTPFGLSLSASGRFDEESFDMRRGELKAGYSQGPLSLTARYAYIQEQPLYGFDEDRQEVRGTGSLRFAQNWTVQGTGTYDIETSVMTKRGIGFGYDDECFTFNVSYAESVDRYDEDDVKKTIGFNLSFRTIGDFGSSQSLAQDTN